MDDDDNFFAVAPGDAAPEAPPADDGADFFGAPPAAEDTTDNAFAAAPSDDAFAAPPTEEETPIILGGPPPGDAGGGVEDGSEPEEEPVPAEPTGPSPLSIWNDEWQETLKTRKDEENAKKAEMLEAARVALENFQKEREMKREGKMAKNREDEQAKLEAIEADLENDNSWQRVCKMVELSHDSTEKAEDVKRMRDALIFLKNDPARAEVLGS